MAVNQTPVSFSDSDNSSSVCYPEAAASASASAPLPPPLPLPTTEPPPNPDVTALRLLSSNLESLFNTDFCADAYISVASCVPPSPRKVPVHRCLLSARSPFFREIFAKEKEAGVTLEMKDLVKDVKHVDVGYDSLLLVLGYMYTGRVGPLPKGVCICADGDCPHEGCRPAVDFMLEVLHSSFIFQISELVNLFQRHLLDILERVNEDDMLVILSVANLCNKTCERLLAKCIEIVIQSTLDFVTLEKTLPPDIVKQIMDSHTKLRLIGPDSTGFPDKHVKRIHRALDSDDVELVRMLLKENQATTLDDAYALHYAVAHCDSKITTELLELGIADVNHRNLRGYTVLHVAAMRREPKIIVSLLTKGARPADTTLDGRKALQISKQLTKFADYNRPTEEGMASPNDRLCIEILENAERTNPLVGEAAVSLAIAGDDLRSRLLYLENRVGLAQLLFPMEAKIAMINAKVDGTSEFTLDTKFDLSNGSKGSTVDDLNEAPFRLNEERLSRMRALSKTVELGRRYFPRCAKVLDKIMDDDTTDLAFRVNETTEEKQRKKERYQELQDVLSKAFNEDKEEFEKSGMSSSSSSTTVEGARSSKIARR